MKQQWTSFASKVDALTQRERAILFVVIILGSLLLANSFIFEPQGKKHKTILDKTKQDQMSVAAMQGEVVQLQALTAADPDAEIKARITEAEKGLELIDTDLKSLHTNLVMPDKIDGLLASILKRNKGLQLISLRSLPAVNLAPPLLLNENTGTSTPVVDGQPALASQPAVTKLPPVAADVVASNMAGKKAPPATDERGIYKHEVELVLQGNYLDMLNYMRELETMPERVYWSSSSLKVIEYPKASLRLNVFTLSLEKKWLNL
jgi:MSHA biogenesis protein MshJ